MSAQNRRVFLTLDPETYRKLEAVAKREDRDPIQQARFIIKEAMARIPEEQPS